MASRFSIFWDKREVRKTVIEKVRDFIDEIRTVGNGIS